MNRRGLTLLELLLALIAGAVLATAAITAQGALDRATRSRAERAGAGATARAIAGTLEWELSSLGSDSGAGPDLVSVDPTRVTFRAGRGLFAVCRVGQDSLIFAAARLARWRARVPVAGRDSVLLFMPGADGTGGHWLPRPLLGGPTAAGCPSGEPGELFLTSLDSASRASLDPSEGTVARVFEVISIGSYGSGSAWQVGQAGVSAASPIQPMAGPIAGADGFTISAWDRDGSPAVDPAIVSGLEVRIAASARRDVAVGPGRPPAGVDSTRLLVRFGNLP